MRPASAPGPGDRKNRLWPKCRRIAKFWARKGVRQHTKYKPYQRAWGLAKIRYSRQYRAAQTAKFVQSLRATTPNVRSLSTSLAVAVSAALPVTPGGRTGCGQAL